MKNLKSQRGQALVLIALAAVVLFGFAALAIDGSRVFADRRHAQNAADTSALAAAVAKIRKQDYKAIALTRASANGYANDADSTVLVNLCSEVGVTCTGLPVGATPSEYIRVKITSIVPMTLGKVVGWATMTNGVEAIARVKGIQTNPFFNAGAGLVATRMDNSDDCFKVNGNADLTLHNTGIFVNCKGTEALFLNGSASIGMGANAQVAGCTNDLGFPISPGTIECNVAQQTVDPSMFASFPTVSPTPTCSNPGSQVGTTMNPGYFNSGVAIQPNTTFNPGTYCFNAALNLGNQSNTMSGTGNVQWVLASDVVLNSQATFQSLEIYTNGTDFKLFNHAVLNASRFRFFGSGSSDMEITAGGWLTSGDAYFFSETGNIDFDAQAYTELHSPPSGDTFGGILIHYPWDNPNDFELNGGVDNTWQGLILMPHTNVTYNGGAGFELHGQVIGYTFQINGGGTSDIYYDSSGLAVPPNDPTVEFTK